MPIRNFQTHSGVIVHVIRPTEKEADLLQSEYGLHPLDAASILEVQEQADASRYNDVNRLQLCLPWLADGHVVSCDITLIWNDHQAIIVHDTPDRLVAELLTSISNLNEHSALDVVTIVLSSIAQRVESLGMARQPDARMLLQQNWQAIERLLSLLPTPMSPEYFAAWRLVVHRFKHLERLSLEPTAVSTAAYAERLPKTATRFAAASVFLFVTVLWALH